MTNQNEATAAIGIDEVKNLIPHRYPFLLIDRAEHYEPFRSIVGIKAVTINEPYFIGHFPNFPIMPGVLQIEAMAQAGAIMMSKSLNVDVSRHAVFFTTIDNVKFRSPVRPGDILELRVEVQKHRNTLFKFRGEGYVRDRKVSEAEFAAMVHTVGD
jgi:3-hydroxyacyl-[acyl-carrier-protein] dehydratase